MEFLPHHSDSYCASGKCKVEETPKGWFITLIQRDPKEELSEEKKLKRLAAEKEEEERHLSALNEQVGPGGRNRRTASAAAVQLDRGYTMDHNGIEGFRLSVHLPPFQVERARKMARTEEAPDPARMLVRDENDGPMVLGINLGRGDQQTAAAAAATSVHGEDGSAAVAATKLLRQSRPAQPANVFEDDEEGVRKM